MGENMIILILGLFFLVVGVVMILSGHGEEKGYYEALAGKRDLREFVTHNPERPEPGALRMGGWACIAVGVLILGFFVWLGR
jgi:uncharacterized protein YjeT (DUF2065 family)